MGSAGVVTGGVNGAVLPGSGVVGGIVDGVVGGIAGPGSVGAAVSVGASSVLQPPSNPSVRAIPAKADQVLWENFTDRLLR